MEGPMMNMDKLVAKPENLGLRPDWSRFMQGMMTFVRVLPPEQYEAVVGAMHPGRRTSSTRCPGLEAMTSRGCYC